METAVKEIAREGARRLDPPEDYNFEHFRLRHILSDLEGTLEKRGIAPGEEAPDFELPMAHGGTLRLSDLRGKPVLLHFGSVT